MLPIHGGEFDGSETDDESVQASDDGFDTGVSDDEPDEYMTDGEFELYIAGLTGVDEFFDFVRDEQNYKRLIGLMAPGNEDSPIWDNPMVEMAQKHWFAKPELLSVSDSNFDPDTAFIKNIKEYTFKEGLGSTMTDAQFEAYVADLTNAEEFADFAVRDAQNLERLLAFISCNNEQSPIWKNPLVETMQKTWEMLQRPDVQANLKRKVDEARAVLGQEPLYTSSTGPQMFRQPKFNEDWKVIPYTEPKKLF